MAYVPMHYTTGNWTVDEKITISPTATYTAAEKAVSVTNWDFASDFSYAGEVPAQNKNDPPMKRFVGTKNTMGTQNLVYTVGVSPKSDVYSGLTAKDGPFERSAVYKLSRKTGRQVYFRLDKLDWSSNGISAEEGDVPTSGWICFKVLDHPSVNVTLLRKFAKDLLGLIENTDDTVLAGLLEDALSGDLDPTR